MPKSSGDHQQVEYSIDSSSQAQAAFLEHGSLQDPLSETAINDLEEFTSSHGLQHKVDVFRKASRLLQHESPEDVRGLTDREIQAVQQEVSHKWHQPKLLYFTITVCSIGAIEQGWAQTAMNGANLYFPAALGIGSDSPQDNFILGLINSGIYFSVGLIGAWLSEPLNNRFGRRGTIFTGSMLCLVANIGSALAWNWQSLLFFRVLLGSGLGINASTVSVFAAECAPASIRGGLAVSWQMFTAFGILIGFLANVAVYGYGPKTWRLQLAAPFIPTVPLLLMVYACPESPAWYTKSDRYNLAYQSLQRLRNTELQAAQEIYATYLQHKSRAKLDVANSRRHSTSYLARLAQLFTIPRIRNATLAACTTMISQQLCGINIISFYSSTIFADSGFSTYGALIASCVFGLVNFLGAFPAIWTMDTLGRRSLLLWTLPFMALTMFAAALTFKLPKGSTTQFGLLASFIYLFCAEYSPGMGPVPSAYSAEVFPLSHREVGMSFAVATTNIWAAILSLTFPALLSGLGSEGSFELYAALNVVAFILVLLFVRETKRKTLDELDEVFAVDLSTFVGHLVKEEIPWVWKRYVLRQNALDGAQRSMVARGEYRELGQVDDLD